MPRFRVFFIIFIAAGLYFAALNVNAPLLYVLTALVLSFLVITWAGSQRSLRKITIQRVFPKAQLFENQPVIIHYEIKNNSKLSRYAISLVDPVEHHSNLDNRNQFNGWIAQLSKKQLQTLTFSYRFPQRGRYTLGPLSINSDYPFGLFHKKRKIRNQDTIRVYPEIIHLTTIPPLHDYFEFISVESRLFIGQGDEFYGVREYRFGDPLRHIHWKGTARHRELMVREVQRISEPRISLCMDSNKKTQAGIGKESTFEYSVKICASLLFHVDDRHFPIEFRSQSSPLLTSFPEILDYLSECQADSETPFQKILWKAVNEQQSFTTLFVLFSGIQDELLHPLKLARERHINTIIIWLNKESFLSKQPLSEDSTSSGFRKNLFALTSHVYEIHKGDSISSILQKRGDLSYAG